jgi:dolichyl-phosphate-mannose-protein mannosyltransferase
MTIASRSAGTIVAVTALTGALLTTAWTSGFTPRTWEYSVIADSLLAGRGLSYQYLEGTIYHFYGPPLYPLLLAAVSRLTGSQWMTVILQAALVAGTALLVFGLARESFTAAEAAAAGLLAATHPGNLFFAGQLHSQTLDVFAITLAFVLIVRVSPSAPAGRVVGTGVALGIAVLCRGPMLPFLPAWSAWFFWRYRRTPRAAITTIALIFAGVLVTLAPMVARGYVLYGRYVPLRTDSGVNLWYGNHHGASGTSHTLTTPPEPVTTHLGPDLRARLRGADEVEQNHILTIAAVQFMRESPGEALVLFAKKLWYFVWFSPHAGLLYPTWWLQAYVTYYAAMLGAALIGLVVAVRARSRPDLVVPFVLLVATVGVTQAIFYVEGRHRWEIEPLLLMFSAVGLATLLHPFAAAGRVMRAEVAKP